MRHKKPALRNIGIELDPRVIDQWKRSLPEICELVNADAAEYLNNFSFKGEELVYADPPYLAEVRNRKRVYAYDYTYKDHENLLGLLIKLPCMVMISGYESELYNDLLSKWNVYKYNAKTHTTIREECVWFNFALPKELHDSSFLGSNYRQRQVIQRRQQRLRAKIASMNSIERSELIQWINDSYCNKTENI